MFKKFYDTYGVYITKNNSYVSFIEASNIDNYLVEYFNVRINKKVKHRFKFFINYNEIQEYYNEIQGYQRAKKVWNRYRNKNN